MRSHYVQHVRAFCRAVKRLFYCTIIVKELRAATSGDDSSHAIFQIPRITATWVRVQVLPKPHASVGWASVLVRPRLSTMIFQCLHAHCYRKVILRHWPMDENHTVAVSYLVVLKLAIGQCLHHTLPFPHSIHAQNPTPHGPPPAFCQTSPASRRLHVRTSSLQISSAFHPTFLHRAQTSR